MSLSHILSNDKSLVIKTLNIQNGIEYQNFVDIDQQKSYIRIPYNKTGKGLIKVTISDIKNTVFEEFLQYIPEVNTHTVVQQRPLTEIAGESFTIDFSGHDSTNYPLAVSCVLEGTTQLNTENLPAYIIKNPWYLIAFTEEKQQISKEIMHQIQLALSLQKEQVQNRFISKPSSFILPEIYGMTIEGNILNEKESDPISNKLVYCSLLGDHPQFHATTTRQDGSFTFTLNPSKNDQDLYLGLASSDSISPLVVVKNGFCTKPPLWNDCHFSPDTSLRSLLEQMYFNLQVNQLFEINRVKKEDIDIPLRTIFGNPSSSIVLTDFVQLASTQEVFNELVPYVKVRKKEGHFTFVVLDETLNIEYENPLVLVDQIPYFNTDKLMQLQPTELKKIEVISRVYAFGEHLFNGIIMISTNDGNLAGLPLEEGSIFVEYGTLKEEDHFSKLENSSIMPDFTNTCFWNVIQKPGVRGNSFQLPQSTGSYKVVVTQLQKPEQVINYQSVQVVKTQMDK